MVRRDKFSACAGMVGGKAELEDGLIAADIAEGFLEAGAAIVVVRWSFVEQGEQAALHDGEACECGLGIEH